MKQAYLFLLPLGLIAAASCSTEPEFDASGIFEATTVTVSAETAGKIVTMECHEGDSIAAGEQIAVIDTTMLVLQEKQLRSQQQSAEAASPDIAAQAASLRSQIAHQTDEVRRLERLLADGAATQKQHDDATATLRTLQSQLDALLSTLGKNRNTIADNAAALQCQRQQVAEQIARSTVVAPITGTVLTKFAEAGEYASPGKPLVKMADLGSIYLRCYFTAAQLADIHIGQSVTVTADFGDGKRFDYPGSITWIADESEFTPRSIQTSDTRANLVYAVKVSVKNDGRLKLGQYGEVRL